MVIGVVKEIKNREFRVGLTPGAVSSFTRAGHRVLVERGAGLGAGFSDEEYVQAGAELSDGAAPVWAQAGMMVKVKEPIPSEYAYFRPGQILFTYLHLAADRPLTQALLDAQVKAVAYETIVGRDGSLPCLAPMSEIAGRMSVQEGAKYLEKTYGGRGVLLSGVPGVERGNVVILGGGTVGANACKMAVGLGANVTVLDVNLARLAYLDDIFPRQITTLFSTPDNIRRAIAQADLVVCAVLLPGRAAPKLIRREDLAVMKPGAVLVDVAVDQVAAPRPPAPPPTTTPSSPWTGWSTTAWPTFPVRWPAPPPWPWSTPPSPTVWPWRNGAWRRPVGPTPAFWPGSTATPDGVPAGAWPRLWTCPTPRPRP